MKSLVLAIDCDDVLIASVERIVDEYNDRFQTNVQLEGAFIPANPDWGAEREVVHQRILEIQSSDAYSKTPPFESAVSVVKSLAKMHELHLVTARTEALMPVTHAMLDKYFDGAFTSVEHVGHDTSKGEVCRRIGADVIIDDNYKHLVEADEHGIEHVIWFGDYPWQADQKHILQNVRRCHTWFDVEENIREITGT